VLGYYVALDSALKDQPPQVRRLLVWCRHCGIPFITDLCNAGREDLGCPFGCVDLHRRRDSNKRSVEYNRSAKGKLKRYQREEERRLAKGSRVTEDSQPPEVSGAARNEAAHDAVSRSMGQFPRDGQIEPHCPSSVSPSATDPALRSRESAAPCRAYCTGPSDCERGPGAIAASTSAEPERLEIDPRILAYVQFVISLLEGRPVHREEILEMLARTKRQHSLVREKRIDYVLRRLRGEPEKPP